MARRSRKYPAWLKAWRKSGSPKYPTTAMLVFIHWTDAAFHEEEPGVIDAWMVGFLVNADDKEISLAMEAFEDGQTRTVISVPAGMVNSITTIGKADLSQ